MEYLDTPKPACGQAADQALLAVILRQLGPAGLQCAAIAMRRRATLGLFTATLSHVSPGRAPRPLLAIVADRRNPAGPAQHDPAAVARLALGATAFSIVSRPPTQTLFSATDELMAESAAGLVLIEASPLSVEDWVTALRRHSQAPIYETGCWQWGRA